MTAVANPLLLREFGAGCRNGITMREVDAGRRALSSRAFGAEMQNEMGGAESPSAERACYLWRPYFANVAFQSAARDSSASFAVPWPAVTKG